MTPVGPTQEEDERDDGNSSYNGVQKVTTSNGEGKQETATGANYRTEISTVLRANFARENCQKSDNLKSNDVDPEPIVSSETNDTEDDKQPVGVLL